MMASCNKTISFDPAKDIPALDGKVILVTGGNIGLGKQSIIEYARHNPAEIWLAARNLDKALAAVEEIKQEVSHAPPIKLLEIDLSSLESVKQAAKTFIAEAQRLDILMLNAGIMATAPDLTKDGYEAQWGTNFMGHALLTQLLTPLMEQTASKPGSDVRVVVVSSNAHRMAPKEGIKWPTLRTKAESMGAMERYGQSKAGMVLWARHMAIVYPQFTIVSLHPGLVQTNLLNNSTGFPWIVRALSSVGKKMFVSVNEGVKTQLWASVSKDLVSGEYYEPIGVSNRDSAISKDKGLAAKLWEYTEKELAAYKA